MKEYEIYRVNVLGRGNGPEHAPSRRERAMNLNKAQRETLRMKFGGMCAYCGCQLGVKWHADHVEAVRREWWKAGGTFERPENDRLDNLVPSCPPCNIDKHASTLEGWRTKLQQGCRVLADNHATYRHSIRFGLVQETGASVVFHFEKSESVVPSVVPRAPVKEGPQAHAATEAQPIPLLE